MKGHYQKHSEKTKKKISDTLKGNIPWNKGKKMSQEQIEKLRKVNLGKKLTEETKKKISKALKGKKCNPMSSETKIKLSLAHKGKRHSKETKRKMSLAKKGEKCYLYIDGRSYNKSPLRYGDDWNEVRKIIYRRDYYTCQKCGIKRIPLDVHHKIPFLDGGSNELDNLISLCRSCHMKEELKYINSFKKNNKIGGLKC